MTLRAGNFRQVNEGDHWKFYKQSPYKVPISFLAASRIFLFLFFVLFSPLRGANFNKKLDYVVFLSGLKS